MKDEYLSFERCLGRLEHSFLRKVQGLQVAQVDFQHPSLRDMLLNLLQDNPEVRLNYILFASPKGISDIIQGIPYYGRDPTDEIHNLVVQNNKELNALQQRLENIVTETMLSEDHLILINSAEALLPREKEKTIKPAELDLKSFQKTPCGNVLNTIIHSFADENICKNNKTRKLYSWIKILNKYYKLVRYVTPIPHPVYLHNLICQIKRTDIINAIQLFHLLATYEPIFFKQVFSKELADQWNKEIVLRLEDCQNIGDDIDGISTENREDYDEKYAEFDDWMWEAEELLKNSMLFYDFSKIEKSDALTALENLVDNITPPFEPEDQEDEEEERIDYEIDNPSENYWTIERLFEDL
ncbi:hypothetical protein KAW96_00395 [candidate division WOR-3 bacterium]|nr:hypothetical protein [candidate division WOR-3 bacterium]